MNPATLSNWVRISRTLSMEPNTMKRLLNLIFAAAFATSVASAQEIDLGPSIGVKGTVNTAVPGEGLKTGFAINSLPDFGLTTRILFSPNSGIGMLLDLEMSGYGYLMRPENEDVADDDNSFITRHSYVTVAPSLNLGGLTLGVGISFPTGQTTTEVDGDQSWSPTGTQASPVLDARLGAMIPLYRGKGGEFNMVIRASYMLGGHYTTEIRTYPLSPNTSNPQSAGLVVGFNYLFRVVE